MQIHLRASTIVESRNCIKPLNGKIQGQVLYYKFQIQEPS